MPEEIKPPVHKPHYPNEIRFSPSKCKNLEKCSMQFYLKEYQKLPERQWSKTIVGGCLHSFFECLCNPRHYKIYDAIVDLTLKKVDYKKSPVASRFFKIYQEKYQIEDKLMADINSMLEVAFIHSNFYFTDAVKSYPPEMEFIRKVGDATLKGIVDRSADYGDRIVCRDFKSQAKLFLDNELRDNIQARVYQMVLQEMFGKPVIMEFLMLRHPPTSKNPQKHIQRVEPPTEDQIAGLKEYINWTYHKMNNFTLEDAYSSPCVDKGFCVFVCSYYKPNKFIVVSDAQTGKILSKHLITNPPKDISPDKHVISLEDYAGCPVKWNETPNY